MSEREQQLVAYYRELEIDLKAASGNGEHAIRQMMRSIADELWYQHGRTVTASAESEERDDR